MFCDENVLCMIIKSVTIKFIVKELLVIRIANSNINSNIANNNNNSNNNNNKNNNNSKNNNNYNNNSI